MAQLCRKGKTLQTLRALLYIYIYIYICMYVACANLRFHIYIYISSIHPETKIDRGGSDLPPKLQKLMHLMIASAKSPGHISSVFHIPKLNINDTSNHCQKRRL